MKVQLGLTDSHARDQDRELGYLGRGARPQRRDQLSEVFSAGACATCGASHNRDCVCCQDCNEPATIGKWCADHALAPMRAVGAI